ncbi:MAG: hypothetical protein Tsb0020_38040 [Haliangiales bacterium]
MKFYCHRCSKPYLIADERVRGKILKIRCKSCSAVITVREGMDVNRPSRTGRQHTVQSPPGGGAEATASTPQVRQSAIASAVSIPPGFDGRASSQGLAGADDGDSFEEWYVSVEGEQHGPMPVARARAWVSAQGADAQVFCWRDGFSDWIPVDAEPAFQGTRRQSRLALLPPLAAAGAPKPPVANNDPMFGSSDDALTQIDTGGFGRALGLSYEQPAGQAAGAPQQPVEDISEATKAEPLGRQSGSVVVAGSNAADAADASGRLASGEAAERADRESTASPLRSSYPSLADAADPRGRPPRRGLLLAGAVTILLLAVIGGGLAAYLRPTWLGGDRAAQGRGVEPPSAGEDAAPLLTLADVNQKLRDADNEAALRRCYQRAPGSDVARVDVALTIAPDGGVTQAVVSPDGESSLGQCLASQIQTWRFRPSARGLDISIPIVFKAQ